MKIKTKILGIAIIIVITCFSGCVSNEETNTGSNILKAFIVTEGKQSSLSINDGALQMDFPKNAVEGELAVIVKTVSDEDDSEAYGDDRRPRRRAEGLLQFRYT